jgi:hypothetical protein
MLRPGTGTVRGDVDTSEEEEPHSPGARVAAGLTAALTTLDPKPAILHVADTGGGGYTRPLLSST